MKTKNGELAQLPASRKGLQTYLLPAPASALADSSPIASAYFLPEKRISFSDLLPSPLSFVTAALLSDERVRSISRAGTVATTLLPWRMFSSTLGPLPS